MGDHVQKGNYPLPIARVHSEVLHRINSNHAKGRMSGFFRPVNDR